MNTVTKEEVLKATCTVTHNLTEDARRLGLPEEVCSAMFMQFVIFSAELMKELFGENYDKDEEDNGDGTYSTDFN